MFTMSKVEEIERAIQELKPEEWSALRDWLEEYKEDAWDRQIEEDALSGRLDALADKALANVAAGRFCEL